MLPQIANAGQTMYNFNFTSKGLSNIILSLEAGHDIVNMYYNITYNPVQYYST